jgi:hypothetical protein
MKSFKNFILEGGNIKVKSSSGEEVGSVPINSHQREEVSSDLKASLGEMDNSFKQKHGTSLFGNSLKTGSTYAGSTKHFMDSTIPHEEFVKHKPTVGDIDLQVPEEHKDKLEDHLSPGSKYGNFTVVGTKKHGSQVSAIMKHEPTGNHHQVDFEPVEYDKETNEPNALAKFSHSSHWDDTKNGIKGAFHKMLLSSVTAAHSQPGIVEDKKGNREVQQIEKHAFSVDKGLRERHKQIDSVGGMSVHKEIAPKDSVYDKDLSSIHNKLFGRPGTDEDIDKIGSFSGLADHVRKHLSPEQHGKVVHKFIHTLWNPKRAQAISSNPIEDHTIKQKAVDELRKYFPDHIKQKEAEIESLKNDFYATKYKSKPAEKINESEDSDSYHITAAFGRFNGPTKEHEKLLDKVFSTPSHKHYVFVAGPKSKDETSEKDPLTADEKVEHLKKLYPEKADSFVAGTSNYTKTPNQAMAWMWHNHKTDAKHVHLNVVAGSGEEGVKNKSSAGGSSDSYKELLNKYNGTKFPERVNDQGEKVGGDYRMNYKSTNIIENPRGTTSGSVLRKFAKENDPNNKEHVSQFKELLHSKFSDEHAKDLMSTMNKRLNTKTESYLNKFLTRFKVL